MKTIISILILSCVLAFSVNAQDDKGHDGVFLVVEDMPEYPGGEEAFRKDIAEAVKYPDEAKKKKIKGKVFVSFVVNKVGKVEDVKIERGVDPLLDKEAMRVIKQLKTWKPGSQRGEKVKVRFTVPIEFALS
jgi:TonB family protein